MESGEFILLHLSEPSERMWGQLIRLFESGVVIRGFGVDQIEIFKYQFKDGEQTVFPQTYFYPMRRVLKIDLDEPMGHLPSVIDSIVKTSGLSKEELLK